MVGPDNDSSADEASFSADDDDGTFPDELPPETTEAKTKLDALLQEVQQLREELGYPRRKKRHTSADEGGWTEEESDEAM